MFNQTDRLCEIKLNIKGVAFGNRINSTMFLLFRNSVFKKASIKKDSNSQDTLGTNVFKHFITNAYRTTSFVIR